MSNETGQMILVAGPYRSGTGDDADKMAANVRLMEAYALPLFRAGHVPVLGEWFALPLVTLAGSRQVGDEAFNEEQGLNVYRQLRDVAGCESLAEPVA